MLPTQHRAEAVCTAAESSVREPSFTKLRIKPGNAASCTERTHLPNNAVQNLKDGDAVVLVFELPAELATDSVMHPAEWRAHARNVLQAHLHVVRANVPEAPPSKDACMAAALAASAKELAAARAVEHRRELGPDGGGAADGRIMPPVVGVLAALGPSVKLSAAASNAHNAPDAVPVRAADAPAVADAVVPAAVADAVVPAAVPAAVADAVVPAAVADAVVSAAVADAVVSAAVADAVVPAAVAPDNTKPAPNVAVASGAYGAKPAAIVSAAPAEQGSASACAPPDAGENEPKGPSSTQAIHPAALMHADAGTAALVPAKVAVPPRALAPAVMAMGPTGAKSADPVATAGLAPAATTNASKVHLAAKAPVGPIDGGNPDADHARKAREATRTSISSMFGLQPMPNPATDIAREAAVDLDARLDPSGDGAAIIQVDLSAERAAVLYYSTLQDPSVSTCGAVMVATRNARQMSTHGVLQVITFRDKWKSAQLSLPPHCLEGIGVGFGWSGEPPIGFAGSRATLPLHIISDGNNGSNSLLDILVRHRPSSGHSKVDKLCYAVSMLGLACNTVTGCPQVVSCLRVCKRSSLMAHPSRPSAL